jgi:hypothetical protein
VAVAAAVFPFAARFTQKVKIEKRFASRGSFVFHVEIEHLFRARPFLDQFLRRHGVK